MIGEDFHMNPNGSYTYGGKTFWAVEIISREMTDEERTSFSLEFRVARLPHGMAKQLSEHLKELAVAFLKEQGVVPTDTELFLLKRAPSPEA